jgi:hypothetical protein
MVVASSKQGVPITADDLVYIFELLFFKISFKRMLLFVLIRVQVVL